MCVTPEHVPDDWPDDLVILYNRAHREARAILGEATDLELALLDYVLEGLPDLLEDYEASWDATRIDPDLGVTLPPWSQAHVRQRAAYVAIEAVACVRTLMGWVEYHGPGIHDSMPFATDVLV